MPRTEPIKDGMEFAAVDMGSNSFHLVVARLERGELRVVDRLKDTVRLAAGVNADGSLQPDRREHALGCLSRFGQRLRTLPTGRVRAVATNAVRRMRNPRAFLMIAETALGHPIEIVSGREEARLIYLGVSKGIPENGKRRLVVDVGGGSTEFIIGESGTALETESLQMGCVATSARFFDEGRVTRKRFEQAVTAVAIELQRIVAAYTARGWEEVYGSSGTAKSIASVLRATRWATQGITARGLARLRDALVDAGDPRKLDLPGLSDDRKPVLAGGVAILSGVFEVFALDRMLPCETAMREGLLYDMLGRGEHTDPRTHSIQALAQRHGVNADHAQRVETTALHLFEQVAQSWGLDEDARDMLTWAARVHEVGLAISHSQHHVHGAYLIEHSDLAGFTREEQQVLALTVRAYRRSIPMGQLEQVPERFALRTIRLITLLRLATLLHRAHLPEELPQPELEASERSLKLGLPKRWLDAHPLTQADLDQERRYLSDAGLKLAFKPIVE